MLKKTIQPNNDLLTSTESEESNVSKESNVSNVSKESDISKESKESNISKDFEDFKSSFLLEQKCSNYSRAVIKLKRDNTNLRNHIEKYIYVEKQHIKKIKQQNLEISNLHMAVIYYTLVLFLLIITTLSNN